VTHLNTQKYFCLGLISKQLLIGTLCTGLLGACATQSNVAANTATRSDKASELDLNCLLVSNCVNSLGSFQLSPLKFKGTNQQGMAQLKATLASYPEARIDASDELTVQTTFSTKIGFKDRVIFVIDPALAVINFKSRSLFGLYDFGKNRSRMEDFSARFAKTVAPAP
jgi:uncharacterized protein (DUF1499 family)